MVRFYCSYCKSYLTHDTASVRRSHLIGKNHIRLVADYYRNVSIREAEKERRKPPGKHNTKRQNANVKHEKSEAELRTITKTPLKCLTRKQKRMARRMKDRDVIDRFDSLYAVYKGSPGFEKVFEPEQRMDIGDLLRVSKQPQRGNAQQVEATSTSSSLPPPRTLAWQTNYTMKYHQPQLLHQSISHTMNSIKRRRRQ